MIRSDDGWSVLMDVMRAAGYAITSGTQQAAAVLRGQGYDKAVKRCFRGRETWMIPEDDVPFVLANLAARFVYKRATI